MHSVRNKADVESALSFEIVLLVSPVLYGVLWLLLLPVFRAAHIMAVGTL